MSQTQASPVEFAAPDAAVMQKLEEYGRTRLPLALREAADAAALHDGEQPGDAALALTLARQRASGWMLILEILREDLDPAFDPDNPPTTTVAPPIEASGRQLPPGARPEDIQDPAARTAYVEAIAQNRARLADFQRASRLSATGSVVLDRAKASLLDAHATLGLPLEDIRALVEAAELRPGDKAALLGALQ